MKPQMNEDLILVVLRVRIHMMFVIVQGRFETAVDIFVCLVVLCCQKNIGSSSSRNCSICLC